MQINITTTIIETENGSIPCSVANVFLAVSDSLALQLIPVDQNGHTYPESSIGFVGTVDDVATYNLIEGVRELISSFVSEKGL